jgi:uncharacterized protein YkwD
MRRPFVRPDGNRFFPFRPQESTLNRFTQVSLLSLSLVLTACGGDGGVNPKPTSATPAAPPSPASAPAPAPAAAPAAAAPAPSQSASLSADKTCGLSNFQQEVLNRVNQARANSRMCGDTFYGAAGPLTWNSKLFDAATGHAADMASKNYFSHVSQDGRTFDQRITAAGYAWSAAGENIAAGQTTLDQVMNDWLKSPGHCVNIMNGTYTEIGVSCVKSASSTYKQYWAMELGLPR